MTIAAAGPDAALAFIEIGTVALVLAVLARLAGRLGVTTIPFYLLAGLAVGEGGIAPLDVSADFIELAGEIGVLLLLLTLGLEYSGDELRHGLRAGIPAGVIDAVANFAPGFVAGLALGWPPATAMLLGGVCWVSSSGVVSKTLTDLDRLGNRETPAVLNLLVTEDLAMAVYLPIVGAVIAGRGAAETLTTIGGAVAAVVLVLAIALRWGRHLSRALSPASDESLLLAVFGLTLLVGGLAEEVRVSAAIGAFLVGLALSGPVQARASTIVGPLRDLFAATFFLFFSFSVDPVDLMDALAPAVLLAVVGVGGKILAGWWAARRIAAPRGRLRAGTVLIARGEFSIVIAALGSTARDGDELGAMAATYVMITAVLGPLVTKFSDRIASALRLGGTPLAPDPSRVVGSHGARRPGDRRPTL